MKQIFYELKKHAPFTIFGALTGIGIMLVLIIGNIFTMVSNVSSSIFYILHPIHIVLSAIVTTGIYKLHKPKCNVFSVIAIGFIGSIGIATLSDSIIPYLGESLLDLPNRGIHIGFIEKPWLTNPAAFIGIAIGCLYPKTKFPHTGHVLISTWASLFHIIMALSQQVNFVIISVIFVFLFFAVWLPCCLSDIVFPLLFVPVDRGKRYEKTLLKNKAENGRKVQ